MKSGMLVLWLAPLLAACAAPLPQNGQAGSGEQAVQAVVRNYDAESITGSHLKRRGVVSAMDGQTLSREAVEDWQRQQTGMCPGGDCKASR